MKQPCEKPKKVTETIDIGTAIKAAIEKRFSVKVKSIFNKYKENGGDK